MLIMNLKSNCMMIISSIVTLLIFGLFYCDAAHILFLHQTGSYSHRVSSQNLADKLAERGHHITYVAVSKPSIPNPNITDIVPLGMKKFLYESIEKNFDIRLRIHGLIPPMYFVVDYINILCCKELLLSNEFQDWLKLTPTVDLIYADIFPECAYGISYKLKLTTNVQPKVALYSPVPLLAKNFDQLGFPDESSYVPNVDIIAKSPLTFLQRVKNSLMPLAWHFASLIHTSWMEQILKENLDIPNMPALQEFRDNISLVLYNGNFIFEHVRSLPPMFVSAPALHVKEIHEPLPEDLETFINFSGSNQKENDGFVYISLGTVVKAQNLPENIRNVFFEAIRAFPNVQFLWRWGDESGGQTPKNIPKNLKIANWFPQQDLLGHKRIRAFITQTGRPSSQEALCNGVPMITFPVLGDQDYNALKLESMGVSINLEIGEVTNDLLQSSLSSILYDKTYKEKAVYYANLFRDLPMKPIDSAVWWTEYILRNDDLSHLKSLGRHQTWYERRLFDVWIFLACVVTIIISILVYMLRLCFKLILGKLLLKSDKFKSS